MLLRIVLCFFCLTNFSCIFSDNSANIAFVYIGNSLPAHAYRTIKQARVFNPESQIFLITSPRIYSSLSKKDSFLKKTNLTLVHTRQLTPTKEHQIFKKTNQLNNSFRNGFWRLATERFFYLLDFMESQNVKNVFHFESDVMLYANVSELLSCIKTIPCDLCATLQTKNNCVPGIVYIRNANALRNLCTFINKKHIDYKGSHPLIDLNDMNTLAEFHSEQKGLSFELFPLLMPDYAKIYKRRNIDFPHNNTTLSFLETNFNLFDNYIFDAAALGIYLDGYDRRNNPDSSAGAIHYKALFNPAHFNFFWRKDSLGRKVPFILFNDKTYRIANLHFHSKNVKKFESL